MNDEPGTEHDAIGELSFARAGDALAYSARDAGEWRVMFGADTYGPYTAVRALGMLHDPDGPSPVFVARTPAGEAVVVRGVPHTFHRAVAALTISDNGGHWGYIADEFAVYLDGVVIATDSTVTELAISHDASRWAYLAADGDTTAVVDERGRYPFGFIVDGTLQFVNDVSAWAALAGDRERRELYVVVDGLRTSRRLDWTEIVRHAERPRTAAGALRQWVAAETRLALREPARP